MDKKIEIGKNSKIIFVLNICVLFSLILFKIFFSNLGYYPLLVNIVFIINIIILVIGIIFNILFIVNGKKYNNKKIIPAVVVFLIAYICINTFGIYLINKPLDKKYSKIANKLLNYCVSYNCDTYETIVDGEIRNFVIEKIYFDYNEVQNNIKIKTKYDKDKIISVTAIIYSENELFSEELIKEELAEYFNNFNIMLNSKKIKEAFDNRFGGKIKDNNIIYRVYEIYEQNELKKIKTEIICNL